MTLPTARTNDLNEANKTYGQTAFNLNVSNCAGAEVNGIGFTLTPTAYDTTNTNLLASTGTEKKVGIELLDNNTTAIAFAGTPKNVELPASAFTAGSATKVMGAQYRATGATTGGSVIASVGYTVVYH